MTMNQGLCTQSQMKLSNCKLDECVTLQYRADIQLELQLQNVKQGIAKLGTSIN